MNLQENVSLARKTTMRIGGEAKYFAELSSTEEVEEAYAFAKQKGIAVVPLGGGSNTIFANNIINALIVKITADTVAVDGNTVTVQTGKILASLINELAEQDLDLSALTGIPGSLGGAVFGNAGQGPKGIWIDSFIETVTVYMDGEWKTLSKDECNFRYRESAFKDHESSPIIWEAVLTVPSRPKEDIQNEIESLIKKRIETQPHLKTAGSCFKALPDGTPAWQCIDAAGLRGTQQGGIQISEKHANFLLNTGEGTFEDVHTITDAVKRAVPDIASIEMRCIGEDGKIAF